jgi:hypothetical protein
VVSTCVSALRQVQIAHSAELSARPLHNGWTAIEISGRINNGDTQRFAYVVDLVPDPNRVEVWLDSTGGHIGDAFAIGDRYRLCP